MDKPTLERIATRYRSHIRPPFDALMDACGFDAVYAVANMLGGSTVYIPAAGNIFRKCVEQAAADEFDGCNFNEIRRKYGFSDGYLRRILKT